MYSVDGKGIIYLKGLSKGYLNTSVRNGLKKTLYSYQGTTQRSETGKGAAEAPKSGSPSGDDFIAAGATGADIAASLLYCIAGSGSCPGSAAFKALEKTDEVWRANTAPIRVVARFALATSVGIEAYQFNQARVNSDILGMIDATLDAGAILPAYYGGGVGVVFSLSYAIGDNLLAPIVVPYIVDAACSITNNC